MPTNLPYPMQFDASQWSNPYSQYSGALPWPSGYSGMPVNAATGQPIAGASNIPLTFQNQVPGTTLNSAAQNPASALYQMMGTPSAMNPSGNAALGYANWSAFLPGGTAVPASTAALGLGPGVGQQQASQQSAPAQSANTGQMNLNQALALLANPGNPAQQGPPVNYGSNAALTGAGSQGLGAFLQSFAGGNPSAQTAAPGIGGGSSGLNIGTNSTFLDTLRQLAPSTG